MFCPSCNTENQNTSIRCIQCGQYLVDADIKKDSSAAGPEIWNPDIAALISWILTPIFGAIIHALNWRILGQQRKAYISWGWAMFAFCGLLALSIYVQGSYKDERVVDRTLGLANLVVLAIWYFSFGRTQSKFVAKMLNGKYIRAGWFNPLCITVILLSSIVMLGNRLY